MRAYGKINIGLHLISKRLDGFHDIETVFHRINLFDEITFEPSHSITLTCSDPSLPTDERNLCIKAALLFRERFSLSPGVNIKLKKQIPVGAGLGGGSSDAATTLRGLMNFWNHKVSVDELAPLALQLGSDVPYFLSEGSAYAQKRGELLEYFILDVPYWIVLVYPNLHILTAWAYQNSIIPSQPRHHSLRQIVVDNMLDAKRFMTLLRNDFEPLVLRTHNVVAKIKQALYLSGAEFAQMSGSGSSVYGFFRREADANSAAEMLKTHNVTITAPHFRP